MKELKISNQIADKFKKLYDKNLHELKSMACIVRIPILQS